MNGAVQDAVLPLHVDRLEVAFDLVEPAEEFARRTARLETHVAVHRQLLMAIVDFENLQEISHHSHRGPAFVGVDAEHSAYETLEQWERAAQFPLSDDRIFARHRPIISAEITTVSAHDQIINNGFRSALKNTRFPLLTKRDEETRY